MYINIDSACGLAPNMQQPTTWSNEDYMIQHF